MISDSSSRDSMHGDSQIDACGLHSRASSQTSFEGLEFFDEMRRGFEFVENRPTFYSSSIMPLLKQSISSSHQWLPMLWHVFVHEALSTRVGGDASYSFYFYSNISTAMIAPPVSIKIAVLAGIEG
ncbi:hypothetical protein BJV77DRAFT_635447 [Russula vinacea]|nr:hypothetical protein BJV77DRAFT_635447 [Russula vinacea]